MSRIPYINTMETTMQKALHYIQCYHLLHPDAGAADVAAEIVEHLTGCPTLRAADFCPECRSLYVNVSQDDPNLKWCSVCGKSR